ncbi:helix-turn-helix transcriptional regulator [Sphingomonas sp. CJ99]
MLSSSISPAYSEYFTVSLDALYQWVGSHHVPHFVISESAELFWMNQAASQLLRNSNDLKLQNGHLRWTGLGEDALATAIAGCAADRTQIVSFPSDGQLAVMRATNLGGGRIGITLGSLDRADRVRELSACFELTRRESLIVNYLIDGRSPEEIGRIGEMSVQTVRTHIKNIYAKIGVASREQFFSRLIPFLVA